MNRAVYYRGLTFEYKVVSLDERLKLTCDGQLVFAQPNKTESKKLKRNNEKDNFYCEIIKRIIDKKGNGKLKETIKKREKIKKDHEKILRNGVSSWNKWRRENPEIRPLLYDMVFRGMKRPKANFSNANLIEAKLQGEKTNLKKANFHEANLGGANLSNADLTGANFCRTDLYKTNLSDAILNNANLQGTQLAITNLKGAELNECKIYGMSVWDLQLEGTAQKDLIISTKDGSELKVGNLQVAQFIYLILHNENIKDFLNTTTSKVVLILGRFTPKKRKEILGAIKKLVYQQGYVPILFDFTPSKNRDLTETVSALAHLAGFVIADITGAKSVPQELSHIIPFLPSVPIQPIIQKKGKPYSMAEHWWRYPWVRPLRPYTDQDDLTKFLTKKVLKPLDFRSI